MANFLPSYYMRILFGRFGEHFKAGALERQGMEKKVLPPADWAAGRQGFQALIVRIAAPGSCLSSSPVLAWVRDKHSLSLTRFTLMSSIKN